MSEDCLFLNVWTNANSASAKQPVMLWAYGGAYTEGAGSMPLQDGAALAKKGVIVVTFNYRLGPFGFYSHPELDAESGHNASGNQALMDTVAALKWVQRNIPAFGGDPSNVTVFGESAGACISALMVGTPLTKGLFKRAVIQSGHGSMVRDLATAQRLVRKLAKLLKISPDVAGFRSVDFATGWAAMEKVGKPFVRLDLRDDEGHEPVFGISRFTPVFGDDVLPMKPLDALKKGAGADVDVLIGTNAEEMNFYFVPTRVRQKMPGWVARWLLKKSHPTPRETLRAYGHGLKGKRPGHAYTDAMTDLVFRWPARRFAEEHRGRTHVYEFDWRSPRYDGQFGSTHGMELPFVFKTLRSVTGPEGLVGESPPAELADRVHKIWVDFATDGSLPWPEFTRDRRKVRLLAAEETIDEPAMPVAPYLP